MSGSHGQGYDLFRTGNGERLGDAGLGYVGTSAASAGRGWDLFNADQGDRL